MPIDTSLITPQALLSLELERRVGELDKRECHYYSSAITKLIRTESDLSDEHRECLRMAGDALAMHFQPEDAMEPFGPMFAMAEQRSLIPTDLPRDWVLSIEEWATGLADPELRARFLDIVWIQGRSRTAAAGAVGAYLEAAEAFEHPENWVTGFDRMERAVRLASSLGKESQLKDEALQRAYQMLLRYGGRDPLYLSHKLIRLLMDLKYGDVLEFAEIAEVAAGTASQVKNYFAAAKHFQLAGECYRKGKNEQKSNEAFRESAEALVLESELAMGDSARGPLAAASILSDAIEAMRRTTGSKDRVNELHRRLLELQQESVTKLSEHTHRMDVTELVNRSIKAVSGKPFREAVHSMCAFAGAPSVDTLIEQVHERAKSAVFSSIMSSQVLNSRGKVVAFAPGLEAGCKDIRNEGLRWRVNQSARFVRSLTVQAEITHARQLIVDEHRPGRAELLDVIQFSPWVPEGHGESIIRALLAGFYGDMLVAGHMVPAQIEAVVRHVVEMGGATTSRLDAGGLQPERSLGPLLETAEAERAFGKNQVFELQGLLVDQLGGNLRNEVAHGLLSDDGMFHPEVVYAWWLLLRFLVKTSSIVERHQVDGQPPVA